MWKKAALFGVGIVLGSAIEQHISNRRRQAHGNNSNNSSNDDAAIAAVFAQHAALLRRNHELFSGKERELLAMLLQEGQQHLIAHWPAIGSRDDDKRQFMRQVVALDAAYPGGLAQYIGNARRLLRDARAGANPFDGFIPAVPDGIRLDFGSAEFRRVESVGVRNARDAAFVLVAGGLGERLGYSGIKVALPVESASGKCFLQLYIESILALQLHSGAQLPLPLAIMTSDDTHAATLQLLQRHNYFGMLPSQVTLMKQEKVACLSDNDARLALTHDGSFALMTKPHGHGDVHALLHSTGTARRWQQLGFKWVCFFQDTNALVFRALPVALGVSVERAYDMNSLAVPRAAKEAIGGIARLVRASDGRSMTVNVEYNQLDPLLRATSQPAGDVADQSGYSPFPGNINQLVLRLESYVSELQRSNGIIGEFVNPKYKDASKSEFKSPTRLECMMQDYPKNLPSTANVGFTVVNQVWAAYSPVKNSVADARAKAASNSPTHSATSAELDIYKTNCESLKLVGADVGAPSTVQFNGIAGELWPRVVWSPAFAPCFSALAERVSGQRLSISSNSAMVLDGPDITIKGATVDGALVIRAVPGAQVIVDGLVVKNKGWQWTALDDNDIAIPEELCMRGFHVVKHETAEFNFVRPGVYYIPESAHAANAADVETPAAVLA